MVIFAKANLEFSIFPNGLKPNPIDFEFTAFKLSSKLQLPPALAGGEIIIYLE
jgi:hypothetical protein